MRLDKDEGGGKMDKQRKIMIALLIIGAPLFIWIQFFEVPNKARIGEEKLQQNPNTHVFEKVMKYESLYMGDASNLGNLLNELPLNDYKDGIELDSEDLVLTVNYDVKTTDIENIVKQSIIYNSTAVFALVENLQQMNMQFKDQTYIVTRDRVETWFGMTLVDFKDPEVFQEKVQSKFKDDVSPWFLAYIGEE